MQITQADFDLFKQLIHDLIGIALSDDKKYLIEGRLAHLLKKYELSTWKELYTLLRANSTQSQVAKEELIVAITTNETSFFRDIHPFKNIEKYVFPELVQNFLERRKSPRDKIKIWCAACSTGQEPYSLAILLKDFVERNKFKYPTLQYEDFSILGTDISSGVLQKCNSGQFSEIEFGRGLEEKYKKNFVHMPDEKIWKIDDKIKSILTFKMVNLINSVQHLGSFDFILCRNVFIYFNETTKKQILEQFAKMLPPKGYLLLGSSEGIARLSDQFVPERFDTTIIYRKINPAE